MSRDKREAVPHRLNWLPLQWRPFGREMTVMLGTLLLLALYILAVALVWPGFLAPSNLVSIARSVSTIGIISIGYTFVMLTGKVDLSCGSLLSLTGCISCSLIDFSQPLAVMIPLLVGVACGCINGLLVGKIGISSFVTTLGMLSIYQALAFFYSKGKYFSSMSEGWYRALGQGSLLGVPVSALLFLAVILACAFVQKRTVFGTQIYAVGSNPVSARFSGVSSVWIIIRVYMIGGAGTALSAIVLCSRSMASQPQMGIGYEFDVLTAVVVGGLSMREGRGSVWGTLLGVILLGVLKNSFVIMGISGGAQYIAQGLILIAAAALQRVGGERGCA